MQSDIQPNSLYQAFKASRLSDDGTDALTILYQPIIGADAVALYFSLTNDAIKGSSDEFTHLDLLNQLNFGMNRFLEARYHLEGMGLLSTYRNETLEFGHVYGYELIEPLSPNRFFADSTYTFLLKSMVGERRFQVLAKRYTAPQFNWSSYTEISKRFSEVYAFQPLDYQRNQVELEQLAHQFATNEPQSQLQIEGTLDWSFLVFHAQKKQIAAANFTAEFSKKIELYHEFYGLDEMELVQLMADIVDISTGMVEINELEKHIVTKYRRMHEKEQSSTQRTNDDEQMRRFHTLKQNGFSDIDLQIIKESEQTAPANYLAAIKHEKNSYASKLEEWIVKDLVERSPLPTSVINVLLHYVLVVQNNSVLPQKLVDKIAADWSEKKVATPEEAIQFVRTLAKEAKETKQKRAMQYQNRSSNKQVTREEQLPKWLIEQEKNKLKVNQTDEKEVALTDEMNQRFQAYLKRKEGEK
ncbi:replication initiation and membrane attachment family protein [Enterococcus camelliae]|uniref:Replication initiation and membrane attachment family protein n=1 Tax=Enterococcus camelliae TaxID=453959 RepID=A0ABW5TGS1_9ENTE